MRVGSLVSAIAKVKASARACCWICALLISWPWKGKEELSLLGSCCSCKPFSFAFHAALLHLQAGCLCRKHQAWITAAGLLLFLGPCGPSRGFVCLVQGAAHMQKQHIPCSGVPLCVPSRAKPQGSMQIAVGAGEHFLQVRCQTLDSGEWKLSQWVLLARAVAKH